MQHIQFLNGYIYRLPIHFLENLIIQEYILNENIISVFNLFLFYKSYCSFKKVKKKLCKTKIGT